jgi:proteic killer suppression protein
VIESFKHKGLKRLYEDNNPSGIHTDLLKRVRAILAALNNAEDLRELSLPGLKLHPLKGNMKGFYAVSVSGNWRIVFRFADGRVFDVELIDYH